MRRGGWRRGMFRWVGGWGNAEFFGWGAPDARLLADSESMDELGWVSALYISLR